MNDPVVLQWKKRGNQNNFSGIFHFAGKFPRIMDCIMKNRETEDYLPNFWPILMNWIFFLIFYFSECYFVHCLIFPKKQPIIIIDVWLMIKHIFFWFGKWKKRKHLFFEINTHAPRKKKNWYIHNRLNKSRSHLSWK